MTFHMHSVDRWFTGITYMAVAVSLAACQSKAVRTHEVGKHESNKNGGLTYYLPMRHAEVTFERAKANSKAGEVVTKARDNLKEKQIALETAQGAVTAQESYLKALEEKGFDKGSEVHKSGRADLIKAEQDVTAKKKAVAAAQAELNAAVQGLKAFDASQPMCGWVDSIKVKLLDPVPDTAARYELAPRYRLTRADHFKIGTTSSGLLKTVDAELKDQTGEILVSLAKSIAARSVQPGVTRSVPLVREKEPAPCDDWDWQPKSVTTVIDPAQETEWEQLSRDISRAATVPLVRRPDSGSRANPPAGNPKSQSSTPAPAADAQGSVASMLMPAAKLSTTSGSQQSAGEPAPADRKFAYKLALAEKSRELLPPARAEEKKDANDTERKKDDKGILYRRERPLLVKATLDNSPIGAFVLVVPNGAVADQVAVSATGFATNNHKVGFENGMLVSLDTSRPSPVLEVVSIPWKIARETLGIVSELIQIRVNYATSETALAEQQVKFVEQMQALIEAQRSLDAVKNSPQTTPPADGAEQ